MLKAIGLPPPKMVFAHDVDDRSKKMSKSLQNVVEPNRLIDTYGVTPSGIFSCGKSFGMTVISLMRPWFIGLMRSGERPRQSLQPSAQHGRQIF